MEKRASSPLDTRRLAGKLRERYANSILRSGYWAT